jgi:hypothetical protein
LIFELADSPPEISLLREKVHATNATKSTALRPLREKEKNFTLRPPREKRKMFHAAPAARKEEFHAAPAARNEKNVSRCARREK